MGCGVSMQEYFLCGADNPAGTEPQFTGLEGRPRPVNPAFPSENDLPGQRPPRRTRTWSGMFSTSPSRGGRGTVVPTDLPRSGSMCSGSALGIQQRLTSISVDALPSTMPTTPTRASSARQPGVASPNTPNAAQPPVGEIAVISPTTARGATTLSRPSVVSYSESAARLSDISTPAVCSSSVSGLCSPLEPYHSSHSSSSQDARLSPVTSSASASVPLVFSPVRHTAAAAAAVAADPPVPCNTSTSGGSSSSSSSGGISTSSSRISTSAP
eukprot:RCo029064